MSARARAEDGFTLVEVLMAAVILVIGLFALLATFDHARQETAGAERSAQAIRVAERELERLLAVPYNSLVENSSATAPATCTARTSIASSYAPGTGPAASGAAVTPTSTWSVTRLGSTSSVRGCVYEFVRWVNDDSCSDANCPGTQDYKRLVVAVSVTGANSATPPAGGPTVPVIVSAVKANPRVIAGGRDGGSPPLLQG